MKHKLIQLLDATIVVSDNENQELEMFTHYFDLETNKIESITVFDKTKSPYWRKIIAGLPNLPIIKYKLSDEDSKKIGYVDVEKLAKLEFTKDDIVDMGTNITTAHRQGFEIGFQKAKSLNDKKFSEEEVISIVEKSRNAGLTAEYIMLSLQTKIFDCEVEIVNNCVTVNKII